MMLNFKNVVIEKFYNYYIAEDLSSIKPLDKGIKRQGLPIKIDIIPGEVCLEQIMKEGRIDG